MLLNALKAYGDSLPDEQRTPPMYAPRPIRYLVELDDAGNFLALLTLASTGKKAGSGVQYVVPFIARTTAPKANLLVDNGEYVFGVAREGGDTLKVAERHRLFLAQVADCAVATGAPEVVAVQRYLEELPRNRPPLPDDFAPEANVAFRVNTTTFPHDLPEVQAYWARVNGALADDADAGETGAVMPCFLCGAERPALLSLPYKIKNVPNGQSAGAALISANKDVFESYGLERAQTSPICHPCAESVGKAITALGANERTSFRRDPLLYLFWSRDGGFSVKDLLDGTSPEQVRALLVASRAGSAAALDAERFYAVALGGSGGRVAVRDWLDVTVGDVKQNVARYFRLHAVVNRYAAPDLAHFAPIRLAGATVKQFAGKRSDPHAATLRALYRLALAGGTVPTDVLTRVVRRAQLDRSVEPEHAALMRLCLLTSHPHPFPEDYLVHLEESEKNPAYLCGRLLAVLEILQQDAVGKVNAGVVDRYYASASSTPALVFGRMLSGAQNHLSRLRRDKPQAYVGRQQQIQEILAGLTTAGGFPRFLRPEDQAWFGLGYYHQRARFYTRRTPANATDDTTSGEEL